jgi:hypothetical protein
MITSGLTLGNMIRKRMGLPPLFFSPCYFTPLLPLVEQSLQEMALVASTDRCGKAGEPPSAAQQKRSCQRNQVCGQGTHHRLGGKAAGGVSSKEQEKNHALFKS